jgi:uncharacterized protein (TIGR03437 family)
MQKLVFVAPLLAAAAFGQTGLYTLNGGTDSQSGRTYAPTSADQSAIYVINGGKLTLTDPVVTKTGNTSDTTKSSQYGLNAGILAASAGGVTISNGAISTASSGSNGLFATGSGSTVTMSGGSISTTGTASHGVDVTYGGAITLTNVTVSTTGDSASAGLSTDYGGGTVTATSVTVNTTGSRSPAVYSTGVITVTDSTLSATGGAGGVIDGANSIILNNTTLTGKNNGIRSFRSAKGSGSATITVNGGSFSTASGELFYVTANSGLTNAAAITVKGGATLNAGSGTLLKADTSSTATFTADAESLTGDLLADSTSKITAILQNGTSLKGVITNAGLSLDASSAWNVTGNSTLTSLAGAGISGSSVTNITGNGYTVTYDATLTVNSYLKGATYGLLKGGILTPAGSTAVAAPAIAGVTNAATGAVGLAPGAWVSIYGTNLALTTALATSADLVNGYLPMSFGGVSVTIDGMPAYVDYVSPDQLNVQAPADSTSGTVNVTVTTPSGAASATAAMRPVMPGIFTASGYVLAVRFGDSAIINGTGAQAPGYVTVAAANAGDILSIFATGLGATTPTVAPGLVFSGTYFACARVPVVTIGGVKADVSFSGLVGAGLYQINLQVPGSLAPGAYPVVITQDESSSPTSAVLRIAGK